MNRSGSIDSWNSLDVQRDLYETQVMHLPDPDQVSLRRIDPDQNMRRFYCLTVQPTLFGGASLIRDWGRIGTRGQTMMETFDDPGKAEIALARLERAKRRRGYRDVS